MFLHCRPVVLAYYSGLDWVEKTSEVSLVEQDEWVVVEVEVEVVKKEVWAMMYEWKSTRVVRVHSGWDGNKSKMCLACPASMAKVLEASFDYKAEFLNHPSAPWHTNFKQGK